MTELPASITNLLPIAKIKDMILAAKQRAAKPPQFDQQETKEREAAAKAYSKESEQHFVDYCMDCINQSRTARKEIRYQQAELYQVYKEKEPASFKNKEPWQSRTVLPKPFQTVQFASASIRKSFSPDFLTIHDHQSPDSAEFWRKVMVRQLDANHAQFVTKFIDATVMALAVGESLEMIPRFVPGKGLEIVTAEPWKIFRDPDAPSRDPQGGMYWIHQEWLDYYLLQEGAKKGLFKNIDAAFATEGSAGDDPFMTKEAIAARRQQIHEASRFRKLGLVSEFWGVVLDPKGNLLLPKARYTVAGGRVIKEPVTVPFKHLRWPGASFSPLPDLLVHGGRGLLAGVKGIWEAMCNLMCLHEDGLKWVVNPMTEINTAALVDPEDVRTFPGKRFLTTDTINGQRAINTINRKDVTSSVLANLQYYDQNFQRGTAVTDPVQGLPGYRSEITWREAEQNLSQALGVFGMMGNSIELGAIQAITAAYEVIFQYAGFHDYQEIFSEEELTQAGITATTMGRGVSGVPVMSGTFHVSGMQQLMRDAETVSTLRGLVVPLAAVPRFAPYINPYKVLRALERRTGLEDEGVFVDEKTGQELEAVLQGQLIAAMTQQATNQGQPSPAEQQPQPPPTE